MNERSAATFGIALGLGFAIAGGILFASGHGLAATCCVMATIALGIHAYRQPI